MNKNSQDKRVRENSENTLEKQINGNLTVIGIGASAGGLEALQDFLSNLPPEMGTTAYVIAQHLSPTYKSMLVQLLSRATDIPVVEIHNGITLESNKIFITPPDSELTLQNGKLYLKKPSSSTGPKPSIDVFFSSLAKEMRDKTIGIILSGTGTDGSKGIEAVKKAGGLTVAQEPQTAKYDGMPVASIQSGYIDIVMPPDKMGEEIAEYLHQGIVHYTGRDTEEEDGSALDKLLKLLSERTGTDFSNYKSSTICRRLEKRLVAVKMDNVDEYLDFIRSNPRELDILFNTILIGVTQFFRDPDAFKELELYLNKIVSGKSKREPIRIWVPGCATGEEAYSIAILVSKLCSDEVDSKNIQIFATDIDEEAINHGRRGVYPEAALKNMDEELIERYFKKQGHSYELSKSIRQLVLFSKHDVTIHPPFLKLDLISCRNLLIYFGQELQKHVIPIFHYALNPDGYLLLGKSETVGQFSSLFTTIDGKNKIFQRKKGSNYQAVRFSAFRPKREKTSQQLPVKKGEETSINEMVMRTLYNTFDHPYAVVDDSMEIQELYGDLSRYLSLPQGAMNANIVNLVDKNLKIELRSDLSRAIKDKTEIKGNIKRIKDGEETVYLRTVVKPLLYTEPNNELFLVIFEDLELDSSILVRSEDVDDESADPRVAELEQELAATKEHLQTYIEEVETANEELQSLNEELQSSNEELQSSNEELETSNEELQSSNEEIQIAYAELRLANQELEKKERELIESENNMQALLNNTLQSFILVDRNYSIITFNKSAQEHSKLFFDKIMRPGDSVIDFVILMDAKKFQEGFQSALKGNVVRGEQTVEDPKGHSHSYIYNLTPVIDPNGNVDVLSLSFLDVTELKKAKQQLNERERLLNKVFELTAIGFGIFDKNGKIIKTNEGFSAIFGYTKDKLNDLSLFNLFPPEKSGEIRSQFNHVIEYGTTISAHEIAVDKKGRMIDVEFTATRMLRNGSEDYLLLSINDISDSLRYQTLLKETQKVADVGGWEYDAAIDKFFWTEEIYNIYELPQGSDVNLEVGLECYYREDRGRIEEAFNNAINHGKPYDLQLRFISSTGNKKWVRTNCFPVVINDKTVRLYGTLQDITERINAQEEIEKLSLVASSSINPVLIADENRRIEWANKAYYDLTEHTEDDTIKKDIIELFDKEKNDKKILEKISRSLKKNKSALYDVILDGSESYWAQVEITPVIKAGDQPVNYIIIARDLTERMENMKELEEARNRAEEGSRLKSSFLANMSHEIRTPLVGIIGYSEVLKQRDIEPKLKKIGTRIWESGNRLLETLNLILDLSKMEANKLEMNTVQLNISPIIRDTVDLYRDLAEKKNIFIKMDLKDKEQILNIDERLFRQVLVNLLSNAVKFTEEGGVTISTDSENIDNKDYVVIEVADTGIGIETDLQELIFDEFRQASEGKNRGFEGTGLGLTLVKKIINLFRGKLIVESEPGKGSKFIVKFPAVGLDSGSAAETVIVDDSTEFNPEEWNDGDILLVENEESHREITQFYFEDICELDIVDNGKDAVTKARKKKYKLIMMDINLGKGLSGKDTAGKIKDMTRNKNTPIVAFTAYAMNSNKQSLLESHFDFYISKPFRMNELYRILNQVEKLEDE